MFLAPSALSINIAYDSDVTQSELSCIGRVEMMISMIGTVKSVILLITFPSPANPYAVFEFHAGSGRAFAH